MSSSKAPRRGARSKVNRLSRARPADRAATKLTPAEVADAVLHNPRLIGLVNDALRATDGTAFRRLMFAGCAIAVETMRLTWGPDDPKNAPPKPSRRKSATKAS